MVEQIRESCLYNGFFQIEGHTVDAVLQTGVLNASKSFFSLPSEEKQKVGKDLNTWNRGYEMVGAQILEPGTNPELKEGFYIGQDLPKTHPYFVGKKLNSGPNVWPSTMPNVDEFRKATMAYYDKTVGLAWHLLRALALSLDLEEGFFEKFMDGAVATMRLLHYPPQSPDCDEKLTRGIGAHTDFGAITLLLQDNVDGLQVWDKPSNTWIDVSSERMMNEPSNFNADFRYHPQKEPMLSTWEISCPVGQMRNIRATFTASSTSQVKNAIRSQSLSPETPIML